MSIYDDPAMQDALKSSGGFFKFDHIGDHIAGTLVSIKPVTFVTKTRDGDVVRTHPQIALVTDDGEETNVTCGATQLKAAIAKELPQVGDRISIRFTGEKQSGLGTMKEFDVVVTRADGLPSDAAQPAFATPVSTTAASGAPTADPQAIAAALAGLTAEQRVALGLPPANDGPPF